MNPGQMNGKLLIDSKRCEMCQLVLRAGELHFSSSVCINALRKQLTEAIVLLRRQDETITQLKGTGRICWFLIDQMAEKEARINAEAFNRIPPGAGVRMEFEPEGLIARAVTRELFCRSCGAKVPPRDGEGTCPACVPAREGA